MVTISGNVSYAAEVNDAVAAQIIALCASSPPEVVVSAMQPSAPEAPAKRETVSISAYMEQLRPKRNPDKILVIAAYITDETARKYFTPQEIKSYFAKAGEAVPANFARDFNWTITTKWLAAAEDTRDGYYVTNKGMEVIDGGFPKALVKETRGKSICRRGVRSSKV